MKRTIPLLGDIMFYAGTAGTAVMALVWPEYFASFLAINFVFWIVSEFFVLHSTSLLQPIGAKDTVTNRLLLLFCYVLLIGIGALLVQEPLLGLFVIASLMLRFWRTPLERGKVDRLTEVLRMLAYVGSLFFMFLLSLPVVELVAPAYTVPTHPLYAVMPFMVWVIVYFTLAALVSTIELVRLKRS